MVGSTEETPSRPDGIRYRSRHAPERIADAIYTPLPGYVLRHFNRIIHRSGKRSPLQANLDDVQLCLHLRGR